MRYLLLAMAIFATVFSCSPKKGTETTEAPKEGVKGPVTAQEGEFEGQPVYRYTLKNDHGAQIDITNYGARVISILVPDKEGNFGDVALGLDSIPMYFTDKTSLGAIMGRYGGRIAGGKFTLNGETYQTPINNGENTLHSGPEGFHTRVWKGKTGINEAGEQILTLNYLAKDGESGFPGNLNIRVIYTLTDHNELKIDYEATTDKATVLNVTHHSYFNLRGEGSGSVLDHEVTIHADRFVAGGEDLIPTGELSEVEGTPFDFREPHTIGERIESDHQQLVFARGYDHTWVINRENPDALVLAATAYDPQTGRYMEVHTTEPGAHMYTGNFLDGTVIGKSGTAYRLRNGFCFETQHFPDSPNHPEFPSTVLNPGETYTQTTIYRFSVK